ncbi:MAG: ArnT family glycosyltransferase [Blastocatellia bacterium]
MTTTTEELCAFTPAGGNNQAVSKERRVLFVITCGVIFVISLGVRLLYWQDNQVQIAQGAGWFTDLLKPYRMEAERMLNDGSILFPNTPVDPSDARILVHPPGYSLLIAALYGGREPDDSYRALRLAQVLCDAAAAVVIFLIAAELLPAAPATISAILVAVSPHFAFNSLRLSPDTIAVLPILLTVYFVIRATRNRPLANLIVAGALIGMSCWLRGNALLLAPWLSVVLALLFKPGKRLRYSAALIAAAFIVIAPITIRNWVVYRQFILLSLPTGINLIQGIAEYDRQGLFGMPLQDRDAQADEAKRYSRPDYGDDLWVPDGIKRDRDRLSRGIAVIRSNPGWFLKAMARRAAFMLSYNDSRPHDWPFNTAIAPILSAEPTFGHALARVGDVEETWSSSPSELLSGGTVLSPAAEVSIDAKGKTLRVAGDDSGFGHQFASSEIAVQENMDYVLTLAAKPERGSMAVSVTTTDRQTGLASTGIDVKKQAKGRRQREIEEIRNLGVSGEEEFTLIKLPFSTGNRNGVRIVISNNAISSTPPVAALSRASISEYGPTPYSWSRHPRAVVRWFQKNLFTTTSMIPLIIIGIGLLIMAGRVKALLILLAVPTYYLSTHAAFSTEYRYILPIHYFLFIASAATIYGIGQGIELAFKMIVSARRRET